MAADDDETKGAPGARQRPPVTIDLTAEKVSVRPEVSEPPKAEPQRPEPPRAEPPKEAPKASSSAGAFGGAARALSQDEGWRQSAIAGLAGAAIALIVVLLLQGVGLIPAPGRAAANRALETATANADAAAALERRVTAIEAMTEAIPAIRTDLKTMTDKVVSLDANRAMIASRGDLETLGASVAALGKRLDAVPPAATRDDLTALTERVNRLEVAAATGGEGTASSDAVNSLSAQLAEAQASVRALTDRVAAAEARSAAAPPPSEGATRGLAIASLRRAAEDGAPFAADVDMAAGLGLGGDDVAALRPLAARGVAATATLQQDFVPVAEAILAATAASDPNAGFFKRLLDSLVTIRPAGPVAGDDPSAVVSRMKDDVARGDLAAALAERDRLPQAGKDASAEWAAKAADRVALDALIDKVARTLDPPAAG